MTRLVVLGLLARRPMSGYEIQRFLRSTWIGQWSNILTGSIYYALNKMRAEGWVEVEATKQTGYRNQAIYAITPEGRTAYQELLWEALHAPLRSLPVAFYVAASLAGDLPPGAVLHALEGQLARLEDRLRAWDEEEEKAAAWPLPEYVRAVLANGREHMEADRRFLLQLREAWPHTPPWMWELPGL